MSDRPGYCVTTAIRAANLPLTYDLDFQSQASYGNDPHTHTCIHITRVFAAADRPARRRGSARAKYSVSHHTVIKPFLLLGLAAETDLDGGCDQQLSDDHQKFMTLTVIRELSWQRLRRSAVPKIWLVPIKI